jgi:hypothetical protein
VGLCEEIAGVQPNCAKLWTGDLHCRPNTRQDVIGVDEQRGRLAEARYLCGERLPLAVVDQGEGVRAGAGGRERVSPPCLEIRGRCEAGDVGRPGGGDGGLFMCAPGTHLEAWP